MAIIAERAEVPLQLLSAAFYCFHRWLSASVQLNQLFRLHQVCLKDLQHDQHRQMTVLNEKGECLVPVFILVVCLVAIHNCFFINIPQRPWKHLRRTVMTYTKITIICTINAAHGARHMRHVKYVTSSVSSVETEQAGIWLLMTSNTLIDAESHV